MAHAMTVLGGKWQGRAAAERAGLALAKLAMVAALVRFAEGAAGLVPEIALQVRVALLAF